jgi:hypothetical protein
MSGAEGTLQSNISNRHPIGCILSSKAVGFAWRLTLAIIELLGILLVGMLLVVVLTRAFSRPSQSSPSDASVKLVRTARTPDGREDTRLQVNDTVILTASNDGVRLGEYADEVEQLEAVAARLASSLGVTVEFTRVAPRTADADAGIPVRDLPPLEEEDLAPRRARLDDTQSGR